MGRYALSELVKSYGHLKGTTVLLKTCITIYESKGRNEPEELNL